MKKATNNQMKKQLIFLAAVILVTVSSWALLSGTSAYNKKLSPASPKCKNTCQEKPASNNAPQTGFFILDSFSGAL
jgi:hypothetical protein